VPGQRCRLQQWPVCVSTCQDQKSNDAHPTAVPGHRCRLQQWLVCVCKHMSGSEKQ
jgi:hypothetical protein